MSNTDITDLGSPVLLQKEYRIGDDTYVLEEPSAGAIAEYRGMRLNATMFNAEGKAETIRGSIVNTELFLVSKCLHLKGSTDTVPVDQLRLWPSRITNRLFTDARHLAGLDQEDEVGEEGEAAGPANPTV